MDRRQSVDYDLFNNILHTIICTSLTFIYFGVLRCLPHSTFVCVMKSLSKLEKHCQTRVQTTVGGCGARSVEFKRQTCRSNLLSCWNHVGKLIGSIALLSVHHILGQSIPLSACACRTDWSILILLSNYWWMSTDTLPRLQKKVPCLTSSLFVFFKSDQNMKVGLP